MTEHKHTRGPWRTGPVDDTIIKGADGSIIANVDGDYNQPDTWPIMEANARLIAAAPDLLAALEAVVDCHAALTRHVGHSDDTAVCLVTARAAIAKAKEGSHD